MITFNNTEKRWLETIFYLLCLNIFNINSKISDILEFIKGFNWTNYFNCDKLINTILTEKILINTNFIPKKQEILLLYEHSECRLRIKYNTLKQLTKNTNYRINRHTLFEATMKEEITHTELFPKLTTPEIHNTIYSFLIALKFIENISKGIKL